MLHRMHVKWFNSFRMEPIVKIVKMDQKGQWIKQIDQV